MTKRIGTMTQQLLPGITITKEAVVTENTPTPSLRAVYSTTYNEAYLAAVRTAPEITSDALIFCHAMAKRIAGETAHTEKIARQNAYLRNGYTWCITGCGALCTPGWARCPQCEGEDC